MTAVTVALVAGPAAAKEGVAATLATKIPLNAEPGSRLHVAWKLTYAEGANRGRPFGANGVFVRLRSATGARAQIGFAPDAARDDGRYSATVVVPEGGIGDVEIGLEGWTSGAGGTHRSDLIFAITNDPAPGPPLPPDPRYIVRRSGGNSTGWFLGFGIPALLAAGGVGVVARRRRRSG